jgi:glycerate kinase
VAALGQARGPLTAREDHRAPVLCCPDKFRGSLTAHQAAAALARGVERTARRARALPLADGGEGTLAVLCPDPAALRTAVVTGPLGEPVEAAWGIRDEVAVVESAEASGLALVAERNDPLRATTRGTGELIRVALEAGARRVIVGMGGSATVDGGLGAMEALDFGLRGADVVVACDVQTRFVDAARVFGPQKGADEAAVAWLEERLKRLAERYRQELGIEVHDLPGSGAAGGLAGGLAALGARLRPGAALVAEMLGLSAALGDASLAITGEGRYDATSRAGKVVGYVLREAEAAGIAVAIVAGDADEDALAALPADVRCLTLASLAGSADGALRDAERLAVEAGEALARGG